MRLLFIFFLFISSLFSNEMKKYLNMTNEILHYNFELKNFNKIKPPFEESFHIVKGKKNKFLTKRMNFELISIFNNRAYVLINEYLGNQLINSYKKWIKIGDKIGSCKVTFIMFEKVIFKCNKKTIIKTLHTKIKGIKEIQ